MNQFTLNHIMNEKKFKSGKWESLLISGIEWEDIGFA